jgi:hypothetical protein
LTELHRLQHGLYIVTEDFDLVQVTQTAFIKQHFRIQVGGGPQIGRDELLPEIRRDDAGVVEAGAADERRFA